MCRYLNFNADKTVRKACLTCRIAFKGVNVCPNCTQELLVVGRNFETPKKSDVRAWKAVAATLEAGLDYNSCGCSRQERARTLSVVNRWRNEAKAEELKMKNRKGKRVKIDPFNDVKKQYLEH